MTPVEDKARIAANANYNEGLDRAGLRDLTGAAEKLKTALQFDKNHIEARNLLGLIYYEQGEIAAALCQWVLSTNLKPENNPAADYIQNVRQDQNRLKAVNSSIRKYNEALRQCRNGNRDIAAEGLRRALADNPKFVKAYQLLALLDIQNRKTSHARKMLKKALRIDRLNPTTLRYIAEVDRMTGRTTNLYGKDRPNGGMEEDDGEFVSRSVTVYNANAIGAVLNIVLGLVIGILVSWLLIAPSVKKNVSSQANQRLNEYANQIDSQKAIIKSLQQQLDEGAADRTSSKEKQENTEKGDESVESSSEAPDDNVSEEPASTSSSENPTADWEGTVTGNGEPAGNQ
ncbi:MAG: tetratricopeptide repeat protein [Eubacterium sp.]|nr:tetratricopeptide repeat protein [Eubacterium sp.]